MLVPPSFPFQHLGLRHLHFHLEFVHPSLLDVFFFASGLDFSVESYFFYFLIFLSRDFKSDFSDFSGSSDFAPYKQAFDFSSLFSPLYL